MPQKKVYALLHNIRSLHNVGSIFRTSDGAGVAKLYLTGYTGVPPRKDITKTALGADEFIPWEYYRDPIKLIKKLKEEGIQIVALERTKKSIDIQKFKPKHSTCLIVGNEIDGVESELLKLADEVVEIPMHGQKESLNVSVAFGIAMYFLNYEY